jgi:hypothetical protein
MKISNVQSGTKPEFRGLVNGKAVGNYLLKKREIPVWDTMSFITATTSMLGFAVGGSGLTSDWLNDLSHKKNKLEAQNAPKMNPVFAKYSSAQQEGAKIAKKSKEGAKTIVPGTLFSKIGLKFAKIGIAFSGIAGIFNGVSMGLPLMSLGETLNLCSSPIIETPLGTGLFGIALSFVFSGRALENDPMLKMDRVALKNKKGLAAKAGYVVNNMLGCGKSVLVTGKEFVTKTSKIFSTDKATRSEGLNFFKDSVFSIKPKKLVIQEFLDHEGKVVVKTGFQNNPYLMHAASIILALGGTTLALSSLFKQKTGQKVGLKTYETGGSFDNMSLSRAGLEKFVMAQSGTAGRISGALQGLCGVTILAGQPGVDEKWGRGIQWVGSALLFAVFAVERFPKAFKIVREKALPQTLIRQWELDLTKMYKRPELKDHIDGSKLKSRLDSIINNVKNADTNFEDKRVQNVVDAIRETVGDKGFNSETKAVHESLVKLLKEKNPSLNDEQIASFFKFDGKETKPEEFAAKADEIVKTLKSEVETNFKAAEEP